jgi:hypothetical protein
MRRREFLEVVAGSGAMLTGMRSGEATADSPDDKKLIGMYVHECWVYNHPYATRTWTDDDWHGYLDGLHRLGFNLVSIWPLLETMPDPLTPSDRAKLDQHRRVIDMAHREFGMKVWIVLCPNIVSNDGYARRATFENRSYFGSDLWVDPADRRAMDGMMTRREPLLKPLAAMDGLVIIDSDPGGYPNSSNMEFVDLLVRHRHLLDQLRPGAIELVYWIWSGWKACGRYYVTGNPIEGTEPEFLETLSLLKERNPEPWGLARGFEYAKKLGLESRVINFNYGAVELEPSFPMTNFGSHRGGDPYKSGQEQSPRGTQANAQTPCAQLPATFAFARGARGLPLTDSDYLDFADDLIEGHGRPIVSAWQALGAMESERIKGCAADLAPLVKAKLEPGPLRGLLLGSANRFVKDLYAMLRLKATCLDLAAAADQNRDLFKPLAEFLSWLERWQAITGYEAWWGTLGGCDVNPALQKLNVPLLADFFRNMGLSYLKTGAGAPYERIAAGQFQNETETLRLIRVLRQTLWEIDPRYPDCSGGT